VRALEGWQVADAADRQLFDTGRCVRMYVASPIIQQKLIYCSIVKKSLHYMCCTQVISLTVVMADGSVVRTAPRSCKSAAGYDLTRLMIGSEGTLGVITEATLRVHHIPKHKAALRCSFSSVETAANVVQEVRFGLPLRFVVFERFKVVCVCRS